MYIGVVSWREEDPRRRNNFTLGLHGEITIHVVPRAIAKISSAAFKCVKGLTTQLVLRELLLRIKLWVFEQNFSMNNFSDCCFVYVHS